MDTELARKLLGVDGSNLLMLDTAWHHRRSQILEQQAQAGSEAEAAEFEALLANLDLARAVLKDAAERANREMTDPADRTLQLALNKTWLAVIAGLTLGSLIAAALLLFIAWLAT